MFQLQNHALISLSPARTSEVDYEKSANIPGKPRESLNYTGGIPKYVRECREVAEKGYEGFLFDKRYEEISDLKKVWNI